MNLSPSTFWFIIVFCIGFALGHSQILTKHSTQNRPMGTYFECAYPYMGGGIYLPCTQKQRERDV